MPLDQRSLLLFAGSSALPAGSLPQPTLAFEYDPTSDGNLPSINAADNSPVVTATDMTGNGRTGAPTSAGTNAPTRVIAGINGVNVFRFVYNAGVEQDNLVASNALSFSSSQYALGFDCVVQIASFAAATSLFRINTASVSANRFGVRVTTAGKIQVFARRFYTDVNSTSTTTIGLTAGVASFLSVRIDYASAQVHVTIDDVTETLNILHGGTIVGWNPSGTGPTEAGVSLTAPTIGFVTGVALGMNALMGTFRCWSGTMTVSAVQTQRLAMQAIFNTPLQTLTVNQADPLLKNKVYRSGSAATVAVAGTVKSGADADIKARLLDVTDSTPATGWETPVGITSSSGLAWSANIAVTDIPDGSWHAEYRKDGERDADAVIDRTNIIGVTPSITHRSGQSLDRNWTTEISGMGSVFYPQSAYPTTGNDLRDRRWSGFGYFYLSQTIRGNSSIGEIGTNEPIATNVAPQLSFAAGGNGNKLFGNLMRALYGDGIPQLIIPMAIGGTSLASHLLPDGTSWANAVAALAPAESPGYDWTRSVLAIGETDVLDGTPYATFYAQLEQYFAQVRSVATDGNALYCYIHPVAFETYQSPTDAEFQAVMGATWDLLDAYDNNNTDGTGRIFIGWTDHDRPRVDGVHLHPYNNHHGACRLAQNIAYRELGAGHGAKGPKLTSISASNGGSTIVGTFTLDGGTELVGLIYNPLDPYARTPTFQDTGLTGTKVRVDGLAVTPSSVAITGATQVTWTLPSTLSTGQTIEVALYIDPDFDQSVMIMDDSNPQGDTIGVPAQPTRLWVSGVVA